MTEGPAAVFEQLPDLVAFVRCAVDIRNVDVGAASAAGVLVTRASAGFIDAVAELAVGFMIDLARGITDATIAYRAGAGAAARMGRQLRGSTLGIIGYGQIGTAPRASSAWRWACACWSTILTSRWPSRS